MKRTSTLTLPYTFCLFCGAVAVVLLMVGTVAWMAHRDVRKALPRQAAALLHESIAPTIRALAHHFEPPLATLHTVQDWVASATLQEKSMQQWPALLLPMISPIPAVRSMYIVKETGAYWRLDRSESGWAGTLYDPAADLNLAMLSTWDGAGNRESAQIAGQFAADPRQEAWHHAAIELARADESSAVHAVTTGSVVTVSSPLRFPDGRQGSVALYLGVPEAPASSLLPRGVELALDPGGARVGQIQDPQTIALLKERALPVTASMALPLLLPERRLEGEAPWYAVDSYALNGHYAWWVIGTVDAAQLPHPALPLTRYLIWSFIVGAMGSIVLARVLGRRITRPLQQVAARAQSIQLIDEHYIPWPKSRFTEVNVLTVALEDMYEAAVEHLDYHDAPLVVWGQPDAQDLQHTIDAEAVRHTIHIPRAQTQDSVDEPVGPIINVSRGDTLLPMRDPAAAAQVQALHGTRKEVRRLQGQLAGAYEELRSTDGHFQAAQVRIKRQRKCLRGLERILMSEGGASRTMLSQVEEILGATCVSIWIAGRDKGTFHLRGTSDGSAPGQPPFLASFSLVALLQSESVVAVQDSASDIRLKDLRSHAFFRDRNASQLLAPIKFVGNLLGFVLAERPGKPIRWKADEELFFMSVAALCSGVVCQQLKQRSDSKTEPGSSPRNGNGHATPPRCLGEDEGKAITGSRLHARFSIEPDVLLWETDRAGCITSIEGGVEAIYGRSPAQLLGQPITFLSDTLQGRSDLDHLAALLSGVRCRGYETEHIAADGTIVTMYVRAKVRRDANDRVMGARGTAEQVRTRVTH